MKKRAFTLSELLIALSIIGITSALIAPVVTKIVPDSDKIRILQHHANVGIITEELLADHSIYNTEGIEECVGLDCHHIPYFPPYNTEEYQGTSKFQNLLFSRLGINADGKFRDGTQWEITEQSTEVPNNTRDYITIQIDTKPNKENGACTFDDDCQRPHQFLLHIDKYGTVRAGDMLTQAFIENPYKTKNRAEDVARANELWREANPPED